MLHRGKQASLREDSRDPLFRSRPVSVIRKGDWKLLMFHEEWSLDGGMEKIDTNNSVELYNLRDDPGERNNLVRTEMKLRKELLGELLEWIKDTDAPVASKPSGY